MRNKTRTTPDRHDVARRAAATLAARTGELASISCLVGFDGFVDVILDAVRVRRSMAMGDYERIATIAEFADRVRAAAGVSTNIELVNRESRFGGNGPLLASGLMGLGMEAAFVGCIGAMPPRPVAALGDGERVGERGMDKPKRSGSPSTLPSSRPSEERREGALPIHPLFEAFAARCRRVVTIGPPGHTDALEFDDGKIMFNQTAAVQRADWGTLIEAVGIDGLREMVAGASVIGMVNWSLCGGVEGIWRGLIEEVLPHVPPDVAGRRRRAFIDLSDPAKRSDTDVRSCVQWLGRMNALLPVTLGLNLAEAARVGGILGVDAELTRARHGEALCAFARAILERSGVETVVIHPREGAAAARRDGDTRKGAGGGAGQTHSPAPLPRRCSERRGEGRDAARAQDESTPPAPARDAMRPPRSSEQERVEGADRAFALGVGAGAGELSPGMIEACWIDGPVAEQPRLSTGAGDHFNAGFAAAEAIGLGLDECLSVATAASGCYVRDAGSPAVARVVEMLGRIARGEA